MVQKRRDEWKFSGKGDEKKIIRGDFVYFKDEVFSNEKLWKINKVTEWPISCVVPSYGARGKILKNELKGAVEGLKKDFVAILKVVCGYKDLSRKSKISEQERLLQKNAKDKYEKLTSLYKIKLGLPEAEWAFAVFTTDDNWENFDRLDFSMEAEEWEYKRPVAIFNVIFDLDRLIKIYRMKAVELYIDQVGELLGKLALQIKMEMNKGERFFKEKTSQEKQADQRFIKKIINDYIETIRITKFGETIDVAINRIKFLGAKREACILEELLKAYQVLYRSDDLSVKSLMEKLQEEIIKSRSDYKNKNLEDLLGEDEAFLMDTMIADLQALFFKWEYYRKNLSKERQLGNESMEDLYDQIESDYNNRPKWHSMITELGKSSMAMNEIFRNRNVYEGITKGYLLNKEAYKNENEMTKRVPQKIMEILMK